YDKMTTLTVGSQDQLDGMDIYPHEIAKSQ
ncbi:hypothetical protein C5S29_01530, partial [ANME-1 cluster archaeon GoMg3.2]|nr:hypothetical protein [ANME-1 cluster archaeon GoMg3.2]